MRIFEIKDATITDVYEASWNGKIATTVIFKIDEGFFHIVFQHINGTSNFVLDKILQFSCVSSPSELKRNNNNLCIVVAKENDSCVLVGFGHKIENRFVINDESIKNEYTFKNLCQKCSS